MLRRAGLSIAVVLALLALAACEKVDKPTSDSTPPELTWHVENLTKNTTADFPATGATVTGAKGDGFRVTLTAKDPEGIHKITMGGGYVRGCRSGDVAQAANGDFAPQTQTLNPDAQGKVLTSIFLINSYDPDVTCNAGFTWTGTTISLAGTGTNYFNGTTNGSISIAVNP
jgi:hypothetical protein